jgi:hypothetical protein
LNAVVPLTVTILGRPEAGRDETKFCTLFDQSSYVIGIINGGAVNKMDTWSNNVKVFYICYFRNHSVTGGERDFCRPVIARAQARSNLRWDERLSRRHSRERGNPDWTPDQSPNVVDLRDFQ